MKTTAVLLALLSPSKDAPRNYTPAPGVQVAGCRYVCVPKCPWQIGGCGQACTIVCD